MKSATKLFLALISIQAAWGFITPHCGGGALIKINNHPINAIYAKPSRSSKIPRSTLRLASQKVEEKEDKAEKKEKEVDISDKDDVLQRLSASIDSPYVRKITDNLVSGEVGERGEIYVLGQALLLLCVLLGGLPVGNTFLPFVFGPGFFFGGLIIIALGVSELGDALSPYPVPLSSSSEDESSSLLKTSGIYEFVRHPLYCGLLLTCIGFGVWTESVMRLIITTVLYALLYYKIDYEEKELLELYSDEYSSYMEKVPGKILPEMNSLQKKLKRAED